MKKTPMTMIQALRSAMDVMLERDSNVVVYGQDVGYFGGVFDTPISEGGIVGTAVGMGAYGLRPVVEIQFADYFYPASDQIVSEAARLRLELDAFRAETKAELASAAEEVGRLRSELEASRVEAQVAGEAAAELRGKISVLVEAKNKPVE